MNTIHMRELTAEAFQPNGRFASFSSPSGAVVGAPPIQFYRDLLPLGSGQALAASVTRVEPMPFIAEMMEYHSAVWEAFVSFDMDSCICVAPASAASQLDPETLEAFRVPAGTMIYLHPGVWHYAPYPLKDAVLHSLVLLPERTYANDCVKISLSNPRAIDVHPSA